MPRHNNKQDVRDILQANPNGLTINDLKRQMRERHGEGNFNPQTVLNNMEDELIIDNGRYILRNNNQRAVLDEIDDTNAALSINYPNPFINCDNNNFRDFVTRNNLIVCCNENKPIVLLEPYNAKIIEDLIAHDPNYKPRAKAVFDRGCLVPGNPMSFDWDDYNVVRAVVRQINIDNAARASTRSIDVITDFIMEEENDFERRNLLGDISLVNEMIHYLERCGCRREKSLASKVCKYLNCWRGGNGYYINDAVVRSILPYYLDFYKIPNTLADPIIRNDAYAYPQIFAALLSLNDNHNITRSELDHILWYCYK